MAAGADVSIVALPIVRGRIPSVVERVEARCTPGDTVACVVTQAGVALNPRHRSYPMLREDLAKSGIRLASIEELCALAYSITGRPQPMTYTGRPVVKVEYRDGTILDVLQSRTVE